MPRRTSKEDSHNALIAAGWEETRDGYRSADGHEIRAHGPAGRWALISPQGKTLKRNYKYADRLLEHVPKEKAGKANQEGENLSTVDGFKVTKMDRDSTHPYVVEREDGSRIGRASSLKEANGMAKDRASADERIASGQEQSGDNGGGTKEHKTAVDRVIKTLDEAILEPVGRYSNYLFTNAVREGFGRKDRYGDWWYLQPADVPDDVRSAIKQLSGDIVERSLNDGNIPRTGGTVGDTAVWDFLDDYRKWLDGNLTNRELSDWGGKLASRCYADEDATTPLKAAYSPAIFLSMIVDPNFGPQREHFIEKENAGVLDMVAWNAALDRRDEADRNEKERKWQVNRFKKLLVRSGVSGDKKADKAAPEVTHLFR